MSQIPTHHDVFDIWIKHQSSKRKDTLQAKSAGPYFAIWTAWQKHLASIDVAPQARTRNLEGLLWHEARTEDVQKFLRPREGQKAGHNPGRMLSDVTRRRYWRVLDRIYSFAQAQHWIVDNPLTELEAVDTPSSVAQLGHILPLELWASLPSHFPSGDSMYDVRDRAILLLLYELALAPEEIRGLRPADLTFDESNESKAALPFSLKIEGKREHQRRILLLSKAAGRALGRWMQWCSEHSKFGSSEWLFVSNRGTQLAVSVLFSVVSEAVLLAAKETPLGLLPGLPKRVGPQVIRNTAIVQMLHSGWSKQDVINFIGIKDGRGLLRLAHAT